MGGGGISHNILRAPRALRVHIVYHPCSLPDACLLYFLSNLSPFICAAVSYILLGRPESCGIYYAALADGNSVATAAVTSAAHYNVRRCRAAEDGRRGTITI